MLGNSIEIPPKSTRLTLNLHSTNLEKSNKVFN